MSARSLNRVLLIGNLTRDPEMRYTPSGTAVCTFGLATNREWVDASGQKQEAVEYHKIVAWNKLAEICSQVLFKGRKCYVSGRLQTRAWQSQDGQERQTTEIVIDEMIAFGEGRGLVMGEEGFAPTADVNPPVDETGASFVAPPTDDSAATQKATPKSKRGKSKAEEVADDIPF